MNWKQGGSEVAVAMMKKRAKRKIDPIQIESQIKLAEIHTTSVDVVRVTRIRYEGNPHAFIDIRVFQRGWAGTGDVEVWHPSKRGIHVKERDFAKLLEQMAVAENAPPRQVN